MLKVFGHGLKKSTNTEAITAMAAEMLKHNYIYFDDTTTWKINFPRIFWSTHHLS